MRARQAGGGAGAPGALASELSGVALGVAAALLALAIGSYDPLGGTNLAGAVGAALADVLVQGFGLAAYVVPAALAAAAVASFGSRLPELTTARVAGAVGALLAVSMLAQLSIGSWRGLEAGGVLGGFLTVLLREAVGTAGTWIVALAAAILLGAAVAGQSLLGLGRGLVRAAGRGLVRLRRAEGEEEPFPLEAAHAVPRVGPWRPRPAAERPRVLGPPPARSERPAPPRRQASLPFGDGRSRYCLPPLSLLEPPPAVEEAVDEEMLVRRAQVLEQKLATFEVRGRVVQIHAGPVITTYEFEPASGIKVNKIVSLADDLAMAMRAMSVRILAPIPGKAVVGIEVSNSRREHVSLREIVSSEAFQSSSSLLTLALGKDTRGRPVVEDLRRMPHLLVAGATGAGKSVFLNAILTSILMRATPRDVRLVLIDPKMLELAPYEEIPHLLVPVITDAKPAVAVLNNLVEEMNERYRILRSQGVRNIDSYNHLIQAKAGEPVELDPSAVGTGSDEQIEEEDEKGGEGDPEALQELPRIVVVIDELADLMMTRRDCEAPITLLAQKARAAGIHLVIATQRPSVDVITGLIKANFPARISFKVASRTDSRTILDGMGADRLLGQGDMLFLPPGTSRLQRLHGAFVSDEEVQRISDFLRRQGSQDYRMDLLEEDDGGGTGDGSPGEEPFDEMYDAAVQVVTESGRASVSFVQRRLQVGYNRAARMVERMEREGIVSAPDHRGAREVLLRAEGD